MQQHSYSVVDNEVEVESALIIETVSGEIESISYDLSKFQDTFCELILQCNISSDQHMALQSLDEIMQRLEILKGVSQQVSAHRCGNLGLQKILDVLTLESMKSKFVTRLFGVGGAVTSGFRSPPVSKELDETIWLEDRFDRSEDAEL